MGDYTSLVTPFNIMLAYMAPCLGFYERGCATRPEDYHVLRGDSLEYIYTEGMYQYNNPAEPISYHLKFDRISYDGRSGDSFRFKLQK